METGLANSAEEEAEGKKAKDQEKTRGASPLSQVEIQEIHQMTSAHFPRLTAVKGQSTQVPRAVGRSIGMARRLSLKAVPTCVPWLTETSVEQHDS